MKKLIFVLLLLPLCYTTEAQVELKASPIPLLWGNFFASVEYGVSDNFGIEGDLVLGEETFAGFLSGKYYLQPKLGFDRFYVSGFTGGYEDQFGIGFGLGYKIVSLNGFLFEAGFGIGRSFDDGVIGNGKLHIGYRFGKPKNQVD